MAVGAAVLWAVNGTVSKVILGTGLSSLRLTEVRTTGACIGFVLVLLAVAPGRLRARRSELPFLAIFGLCGLAFVQLFYFLSIHRLAVGIALLIEYLGALLVALWARYVFHERVRRRIWLALVLALAGLALIVNVTGGGTISATGVAFALTAAVGYTSYLLLAERGVGERDAVSLLAWGFGFAALFFAIIGPWWSFPASLAAEHVSLLGRLASHELPVWALLLWVIVPGTIIPFFLLVSALRHLSATRVAIIAMLEPVVATVVAWAWLGETLTALQLVGAAIVLAAIVLAQTAR
ncbi:MAG TPA: EamA family transporter [Gaiellaceae bacterium]|jgi:drug/metabolite transporter (DMT)-like permease